MSLSSEEQIELPDYATFMVQLTEKVVGYQALAPDDQGLKENLAENISRVVAFMLEVLTSILSNPKSRRYPPCEALLLEAQKDMEEAKATFQAQVVGKAATNSEDFYQEISGWMVPLTEKCCGMHSSIVASLTQMIELDGEQMKSALAKCNENLTSNNDLVAAFNDATVQIANTAESCSFFGAQRYMAGRTRELFNSYLELLNDLNAQLTQRVNTVLSAPADRKHKARGDFSLIAANLEQAYTQIQVSRGDELRKVELIQGVITSTVASTLSTKKDLLALESTLFNSNVEMIKKSGPSERLKASAEAAGFEITPAMSALADDAEQIEFAMNDIHRLLSNPDSLPGLKRLSSVAAPRIQGLSTTTMAVINERLEVLNTLSKDLNDIMGAKVFDLAKTMTDSSAAGITVDEVLEGILDSLSPKGKNVMLDNPKAALLRSFLKETLSARKQSKKGPTPQQAKARVEEYHKEFPEMVETSRASLEKIGVELEKKVNEVYTQFVDASNHLAENGFGEGRKETMFSACNKVNGIVEISTSLLPIHYAPITLSPMREVPELEFKGGDMLFPIKIEGHEPVQEGPAPPEEPQLKRAGSSFLTSSAEVSREPSPEPADRRPVVGKLKKSPSSYSVLVVEEDLAVQELRRKREEELKAIASTVKRTVVNIEYQAEEKALTGSTDKLVQKRASKVNLKPEEVLGPVPTLKPSSSTSSLASISSILPRRPISMSPDDQSVWDEQGTVQFDAAGQVKAGTFNQLLIHLTMPYELTSDSGSGSSFFGTFMVTLQTFTTPQRFIEKLVERYNVPEERLNSPEATQYETFNAMKAKVCNVLKKYISQRHDQDLASNSELVEDIRHFISEIGKQSDFLGNNLSKTLDMAMLSRESTQHSGQRHEPGGLDKLKFFMFDPTADRFEPFSPLSFSIREVAIEITLLDAKLFKAIRLFELANQNWTKKDADTKCPNLLRFIEHSNRIAVWTSTLILSEPSLQKRRKIMKNLIILCQCLKTMRNFHSAMAVLSGLSSACISRLKYTRSGVPQKILDSLQAIEDDLSSTSSFKNYRNLIKQHKSSPTIPFLGVMLQDLIFIEDGNPSLTEDGLINWTKRSLLFSVLEEFRNTQLFCRFEEAENGILKGQLLKSISSMQKTPSELYQLSLDLEPRSGPPPQEDSFSLEGLLSKIINF